MKLNYLVILGTMALTFGCAGQAEVSQPPANSPTINTASPTNKQSNTATKTINRQLFGVVNLMLLLALLNLVAKAQLMRIS